jgi:two-component system LytT family response regulator
MIRSVVIDDEKQARLALISILKDYFQEIELVGEAGSPAEAISIIKEKKPDLVFMDVMLQTGTGFDILEQFDEIDFNVIFVTAHSEYAYQSIRSNATDYLLKPLRIKDLKDAIGRVKDRMQINLELGSHILVRSNDFNQSSNMTVVPDNTGFSVLRLDEIVRCEASRNYTVIHLKSGKQIAAVRGISDFEAAFENFGFVRVHKSHLVNLFSIRRYIRGRGGEIELFDGNIIPVARERKDALLDKFLR